MYSTGYCVLILHCFRSKFGSILRFRVRGQDGVRILLCLGDCTTSRFRSDSVYDLSTGTQSPPEDYGSQSVPEEGREGSVTTGKRDVSSSLDLDALGIVAEEPRLTGGVNYTPGADSGDHLVLYKPFERRYCSFDSPKTFIHFLVLVQIASVTSAGGCKVVDHRAPRTHLKGGTQY